MLAIAVMAFRFLQYSGAMILFGSSLFFLYGLPARGACAASSLHWPKQLLMFGAAALIVGAVAGLVMQTALLAGSLAEGFKFGNLYVAITQMNFGLSSAIRAIAAALLLFALVTLRISPKVWLICAAGGAIICASFAWMGHGAATEGLAGFVHLLGDIIHSLAAAIWIGALVGFLFILRVNRNAAGMDTALYRALTGFSGVGSLAVAALVVTGLVNSWFLIGPARLTYIWTSLYGQVLLVKLTAFAGMLGFAAFNRYRLTPALGEGLGHETRGFQALSALRRSLLLETFVAFIILGLVAWLGTLAPIAAE